MPYGPRAARLEPYIAGHADDRFHRYLDLAPDRRMAAEQIDAQCNPVRRPLYPAAPMPPVWRACLLERKRSYLTERGLFSRKAVKGRRDRTYKFHKGGKRWHSKYAASSPDMIRKARPWS